MLFIHTIDKVLSHEKTQTRRLIKPGERLLVLGDPVFPRRAWIDIAFEYHDRVKWEVGKTYAVQPGRGQKAVGRIEITGIRREDVRQISYEDAIAEGLNSPFVFLRTWVSMHDKPADTAWFKHSFADGDESGMISDAQGWMSWLKGQRPAERYQAWVLEFRLVETS